MKPTSTILALFVLLIFTFCNDSNRISSSEFTDPFVGIYGNNYGQNYGINSYAFLEVTRAGEKGYFIKDVTLYGGRIKYYYCEFKDGCLIKEVEKIHIYCKTENGNLMGQDGKIYYKKK